MLRMMNSSFLLTTCAKRVACEASGNQSVCDPQHCPPWHRLRADRPAWPEVQALRLAGFVLRPVLASNTPLFENNKLGRDRGLDGGILRDNFKNVGSRLVKCFFHRGLQGQGRRWTTAAGTMQL